MVIKNGKIQTNTKVHFFFANNNFKMKKSKQKKIVTLAFKNSINEQSYCLFSHLKALL